MSDGALDELRFKINTLHKSEVVHLSVDPLPSVSGLPRSDVLLTAKRLIAALEHPEGEKIEHVAEWPSDWWEAVKERFAPRWFRARWPVLYRCVIRSDAIALADCALRGAMGAVTLRIYRIPNFKEITK